MEIIHRFGTAEGIGGAISKMKIEIEDEGAFNLLLTEEFFNGDSNIIEVAESPTGMGTSMVSRGSDQTESGLTFKSHFRCQDGSSRCQNSHLINLGLPFDELNMILSMNSLQIPL